MHHFKCVGDLCGVRSRLELGFGADYEYRLKRACLTCDEHRNHITLRSRLELVLLYVRGIGLRRSIIATHPIRTGFQQVAHSDRIEAIHTSVAAVQYSSCTTDDAGEQFLIPCLTAVSFVRDR